MYTGNRNVEKAKNISADAVLFDILDTIFYFLSIKYLFRAAVVCKSWLYIANLEIAKCSNIEALLWARTTNSDTANHDNDRIKELTNSKYLKNKWHISDSMRSLPKLILLFNDMNETELRTIEQCNV